MPAKAKLKQLIGKAASIDWLEKLTEYAIAEQAKSVSLEGATAIAPAGTSWQEVIDRGREELWTRTLEQVPAQDLLLLEFGVWQGESTRFFAGLNRSPSSRFYGFDSFEGLPEDWRGMAHERSNATAN